MNIDILIDYLSYAFIQRAILVGLLIALSSSFLGIFLVLRKYSMIGDGLAHVSFAAIAIALFFQTSPLILSIPTVSLASLAILKLSEENRIGGDAAIGLISSTAIALGVMIASKASGFNVDLFSYLFGSILLISNTDVQLSLLLSVSVIALIVIFYDELFAVTYDAEFAQVSGRKTRQLNQLLAILTSITIVLGIRVVGTMLISSLIIFPSVSAMRIARSFKGTIALSAVIASLSVLFGIGLSLWFDLPTGSTIVLTNAGFFLMTYAISSVVLEG
jgi:ABC-type Mn2+/Zn2+ transport system permease subunit